MIRTSTAQEAKPDGSARHVNAHSCAYVTRCGEVDIQPRRPGAIVE